MQRRVHATFQRRGHTGTATITATYGALSPMSVSITVTGGPVLAVTKVADPPPARRFRPGRRLLTSSTVANTGTAATGFVLTDVTPANASYVPGSAEPQVGRISPDRIRWWLRRPTLARTDADGHLRRRRQRQRWVTNHATIDSDQIAPQDSNSANHPLASAGGGGVYLPIILGNSDGSTPPQPPNVDLVIQSINFRPARQPAASRTTCG